MGDLLPAESYNSALEELREEMRLLCTMERVSFHVKLVNLCKVVDI